MYLTYVSDTHVVAVRPTPVLARLGHVVYRRRRVFIAVWVALTIFGVFSAIQVNKRWLEQFSIPGFSAYEANQRTLETFGNGAQAPMTLVFHSKAQDVTQDASVEKAIAAAVAANPGSRVSSYFSTHNDAYVSEDRHTTFANIYPAGRPSFTTVLPIKETRTAARA